MRLDPERANLLAINMAVRKAFVAIARLGTLESVSTMQCRRLSEIKTRLLLGDWFGCCSDSAGQGGGWSKTVDQSYLDAYDCPDVRNSLLECLLGTAL